MGSRSARHDGRIQYRIRKLRLQIWRRQKELNRLLGLYRQKTSAKKTKRKG